MGFRNFLGLKPPGVLLFFTQQLHPASELGAELRRRQDMFIAARLAVHRCANRLAQSGSLPNVPKDKSRMCRRSGPVAKQASRLRTGVEHEHPDQELRSQALRLAMGAVGQLGAADSVGKPG